MSPATLMAMQRMAGNRATVQALGRRRMSGSTETLDRDDEGEMAEGVGTAAESMSPMESDVAAGPPDGGPPTAGGPPAGGANPNPGSGEFAARGRNPNPRSGELATATAGGLAAGGPNPSGRSGEFATSGAGGLASGANGPAGRSGETATAKPGLLSGTGAANEDAGKSGETATAKPGLLAGASPATPRSGETARRVPPPPIIPAAEVSAAPVGQAGPAARVSGGQARNVIGMSGGAGPGAGRGNAISIGGDGARTATPQRGNAVSLDGDGAAVASPGGNAIGIGSAQASAAASPAPGGVPDPESARTGIDWNQMLSDYGPPARTVLEVTRLIPGWGLVGGLAADSINFASDLASIPNSENADLATGLIVFRNLVNIGNNGLGHVLYVNQLIQDGLAGSVVGAEFTPLTAAANETLSTVKVVLDEVMMGTDIIIEVEALYESNHAPTSAEANQWKSLADGYAANILGDVVNVVLDVISLSSAGAANTGPVQQARQPLTLAGAFMKNAAPNIISAINGVLGVWLGSLVTEGRQAYVGSPAELRNQALALDAAGLIVDIEGPQARTTYDGINLAIDALSAYADDQIAQINVVAEALSGGKSAFELIRDAVRTGLDDMNRKLSMVEQLGASASNGQTNAASISAACAAVLGALDALVVPDVTLPSVDLGEGVLADAAEAIANQATQAGNAAIRLAMSNVQRAIDTAKAEIRGTVVAAQERAESLGEWLALLATECTAMVGTLNGHIAAFSEGLSHCTNVEQVIDLIIGQVSDMTGMPRFTVQEIRDLWNGVGPYIDQFVALGPQMHERATDLRAHADLLESGSDAGPTFALPPGPPSNPGEEDSSMAAVA